MFTIPKGPSVEIPFETIKTSKTIQRRAILLFINSYITSWLTIFLVKRESLCFCKEKKQKQKNVDLHLIVSTCEQTLTML